MCTRSCIKKTPSVPLKGGWRLLLKLMEKYEIEKLRNLPIVGVAERLGLKVKKKRTLCCFHDDHTPSMHLNIAKNNFRCYACGAHGDVISLCQQVLGVSFYEACKWLANENNILLTEYKPKTEKVIEQAPPLDIRHLSMLVAQPYLNDEARRFLFDERHIHPAVVKWLGLSSISSAVPMSASLRGSWFNAPSLLIPYRTIDSRLATVQARYLGSDHKPRFQFPKARMPVHIFNLPVLTRLRDGEELQICEGTSDCMAALSSGVKAVSIPSATLLSHSDMQLLSTYVSPSSKLIVYPDQDDAGERLYEELVHVANDIGRCLIRRDLPKGCKDFGDYWVKVNG